MREEGHCRRRFSRGLLKTLPVALIVSAALLAQPVARAEVVVPMLACPLGCGVVQTHTVLAARMAREGSELLPAGQETPGFMYNIRAMAEERRWKTTVFGTIDTVIQAAFQGGRPELERFVPEPIPIRFKLLYGEGLGIQGKFFVTFDPDIGSIADLKGKRVSIGLRTQSDWGMVASLILEHGYGITDDNTDIQYVTPAVLTQELIDGNTDAALMALITNTDRDVWWTAPLTSRLEATGRTIHYLPVSEEAIQAVNEKLSMTLLTVEVPTGTLPSQSEPFLAGASRVYEAVHPSFPEDTAYELVMAVARHGPDLKKSGQGLWRFWSPSNMVAGLSEENAHPGAIRAYKELDWWSMRDKYPPVTYPER